MATLKVTNIKNESFAGDQLYLKTDGKVGIGTTDPDAPLTIHNSTDPEIRFGYNASQDHRIAWDSSKLYIHADPDNANGSSAIGLAVDGTSRLYINDSGNIGIGTTNPLFPSGGGIEIYNSSVPRLKLSNATTGSTALDGSQIYLSANDLCIDHKENGDIKFYTAGVEKMRLTSGGLLLRGSTTSDLSGNHSFISVGARHAFQYEGSAGTYLSLILGSANGSITIDANARSGNYPALLFNVGGSEKVRFSTNGSVGIGTDTSASSAKFQVSESDSTECYMQVTNQTTGYDGNSGLLVGINNSEVAKIMQMENLGLDIGTNGNNRISIANDGHVTLSNAISFNAETGSANRLDDYEEGTWTPTIYGGTTAGSYSYEAVRTGGKYTKIGNMVYIEGVVRISSINSAGAGDLYIGGIPFSTSGPPASSWTIGKGVQVFHYGTNNNSTADDWPPPFVGTASGGQSAFNIRSYGKNYNLMPAITDLSASNWIYQIAGWYPVC